MKNRRKIRIKVSLMTIVFTVISLISVTLAWFAYSGMSKASLDVNVKAWYIELEKSGQKISNQIVISLDNVYPGMETYSEMIKIKNKGDSDATVKYSLDSVRIFNEDKVINENSTEAELLRLEDELSQDYPFHVNMSLDKNFAKAKNDEATFNISISWPLDSGNDEADGSWGNQAYSFQNNEKSMKESNPSYVIRPSIKIIVNLTAEQYIGGNDDQDLRYPLGKSMLYDVVNQKECDSVSATCLNTSVIDIKNKVGDSTVTLLPYMESIDEMTDYANYDTVYNNKISTWNVQTRKLVLGDLIKPISKDVVNSVITANNLSDRIIGNVLYTNRLDRQVNGFIDKGMSYKYSNDVRWALSSDCYWINTNYDNNKMFAGISNMEYSTIYGEDKTKNCKVVPVIIVNKSTLE